MIKYIVGLLMGFMLAAPVAAIAVDSDRPAPVHPESVSRPCKYEDSVNCYWNAGEQGNGKGQSFIVRQFPGKARMVCVMYQDRAYAKKNDYCTGNQNMDMKGPKDRVLLPLPMRMR